MIRLQILQTNIFRIVWQIVRRITNEILGVRGLSVFTFTFQIYQPTVCRKRESFVAFAQESRCLQEPEAYFEWLHLQALTKGLRSKRQL